tara:strand:+ start:433 stop:1044 length:612 start_codon:yes stop_codon:yes gene_type:complete
MHGFEVYRMYLAMKQHFSNPKFDFFQYNGQVNAKEKTYQERNDFWFFETVAKKLTTNEVQDFLLASFIRSSDPSKVWIGDIKRLGKDRWLAHQKQTQSMSYLVEQDLGTVVHHMEAKGHSFNDLFATLGTHPPLLKLYVQGLISIETMVVMDICLGYSKVWDTKLDDPLWGQASLKIKKYKPFLSISTDKYKKIMKEKLSESR